MNHPRFKSREIFYLFIETPNMNSVIGVCGGSDGDGRGSKTKSRKTKETSRIKNRVTV